VKGYNAVDDTTVQQCYQTFLDQGIDFPKFGMKEVTRNTVGSVHHYFEAMFRAIISTLELNPDYNGQVNKIYLGYEEPLAPSRHIPDYNIRDKRELRAGLGQTRLIIELKRETRSSRGETGGTNLIIEGLSDSIGYCNAVIIELMNKGVDIKEYVDIKKYENLSIVSLALTPVELIAVRLYTEACKDENGIDVINLKQVSTRAKKDPDTLHLHGETPYPGCGFKLLVNAFYWSSHLNSWLPSPLAELVLTTGKVLTLGYRLGMGGSSDTYETSDVTAVKICHNDNVSLLREERVRHSKDFILESAGR